MLDSMNFPLCNPYTGIMSLRSQLENQMAQLNCSLATQMQFLAIQQSLTNYEAWSVPQYCCYEGKPKKTNCVNCGAPLQGKHKCSYCDSYNQ